jgi:hypothetical protein
LGPDCLPDSGDDINPPDDRCEGYPSGWFYHDELCQCVSSGADCEIACEGDFILDPISKCGCMTSAEISELYSNSCDP